METITAPSDLPRERDLQGRRWHAWLRRAVLLAMLVFVGLALAGVFGQRTSVRAVSSDAAELRVRSAQTLRGGLFSPVRIEVIAHRKIVAPQLVLGPGYIDGAHLNSLEPAPVSETSRPRLEDGAAPLALTYPTLEAGDELTVYLQLQINPTTIGRQDVGVALEGANVEPLRAPATLTVLP